MHASLHPIKQAGVPVFGTEINPILSQNKIFGLRPNVYVIVRCHLDYLDSENLDGVSSF